jgi:hypothetical protein
MGRIHLTNVEAETNNCFRPHCVGRTGVLYFALVCYANIGLMGHLSDFSRFFLKAVHLFVMILGLPSVPKLSRRLGSATIGWGIS